MKLQTSAVRTSLLLVALILAFSAPRAAAQSQPDALSASQVQAPAVAARITQAIDEAQLVRLPGNVHPLARPDFDQGLVADSQPMNRILLLLQRSPEQEAALQKLMEEQQSKDSPNFHKWLTPQQFGAQFGPADADIQAVSDWLARQGFQGIKVGAGRTVIEFSGNVGQVRNALHTEIHGYQVHGEMRQANLSDPQIPAALTPVVAGIVSLHNFPRKSMRHTAGSFTRMPDGRVVPQFTGSTNQFFAVGPADFAKIYNVPAGLDGSGVNVAIVAVSNINIQDVRDFRALFGLPVKDPTIVLNGPDPGLNGAEGEADLDAQWAGAVAPNANIDVVVSEDTLTSSGVDLGAFYVIDNNTDAAMSLSFGECEAGLGAAGNAFFNALWEQAAAQGITVTVSAGDPGSAGCDDFTTAKVATSGLAVSGLASTPFNVAVGGTDFNDVGNQATFWNQNPGANDPVTRLSVKGYIPETTWNNSCAATADSTNLSTVCATANNIVGGSGGPSGLNAGTFAGYAKPPFQSGITPNGIAAGDDHRYTPDVSLFASNGPQSKSFYVACQADALPSGSPPSCASTGSFSFFGVGGTSVSSPAFAGIMALIEQSEKTRVPTSSARQGNANLVLYKIAQTASNSCNSSSRTDPTVSAPAGCVFNDVTKGNNSVPCAGNSPNCSSKTANVNGVLVSTASPTTPAWTTAAGYDLATGLGSVNVTNLATAWATAVGAFKASSTSLKINGSITPPAITHGTSVTAAVTVVPTTGTVLPAGDVSLIAPTTVNGGIGAGTLTAGTTSSTATITTTFLPGGTYSVTAHYAGDGTFAPSDSTPGVPVVVTPETSRLQVGIVTFNLTTGAIVNTDATSFAYGSPYILRMDILNSTTNACQVLVAPITTGGCAFDATGSVMITDAFNGGAPGPLDGGSFTVNSAGSAEDQPIQLLPGTHAVSATYSGDISYAPPLAAVNRTLTVSKATSTTAVSSSPSSILSGASATLTATIATQSNGAAPTGTVQFLNGTTPITGTVTYIGKSGAQNAPGFATLTATLTTTLSALTIPQVPAPRAPLPVAPVVILACFCAIFAYLALRLSKSRRRGVVYVSLILLAGLAAGIAGCGGSNVPPTKSISISAQYSGDGNYTASTGQTTVTVQ